MKDNAKINISGRVTIIQEGKVTHQQANSISEDFLEILMRCLSAVPESPKVDEIKVIGDFEEVDVSIINSEWNSNTQEITFIGMIAPTQANGIIDSLELRSSLLNLRLASQVGLNIIKTDITQAEVRWTIKITQNN